MLPAITDACTRVPNVTIDWVVEEGFAEVPSWHHGVRRTIPIAIRRWRKSLLATKTRAEIRAWHESLQQESYDVVLDTQGLLKSSLVSCLAHGTRHGYDWHSIREPLASVLYQQRHPVSREQHAVTRNRLLTATALDYTLENLPLDYGIAQHPFAATENALPQPYIVALHGTSRPAKEWAEAHWQMLIQDMAERGIHTLLPWGNQREQERATRLAKHPYAHCLPRCHLGELAALLQGAKGVIGMDTGLMHIAAALDQRGLALYPSTAPQLTGIVGNSTTAYPITSVTGEETNDAAIIVQRLMDLLGI